MASIFSPTFSGISQRWGGPGNLIDFLGFLVLSSFWTAWRNQFSSLGLGLGVLAFFFGAPFLTGYLLYLSYATDGDAKTMLVGQR